MEVREYRSGNPLCMCGCGEAVKRSHAAGAPFRRYLNNHDKRRPHQYSIDPTTGCWTWGRTLMPNGYASMWDYETQTTVYVHRWYYEHHVGPIPAGMDIDHLCRNRACCNPEHLEPVTRSENLRRGHTSRQGVTA